MGKGRGAALFRLWGEVRGKSRVKRVVYATMVAMDVAYANPNPRESRRPMVRSHRILLAGLGALAIASLALAGCASPAGGSTSVSPTPQQTTEADPDLGAAWLDGGRM